ncbi:MAG: UbiA-like polyprenyltransferase [Desulfotomaculales bacterium]
MVFRRIRIFLEMIKFEHSVFALPFAYIGALLVGRKIPSAHDLVWITLAMVGARTAAMSLNRIIDREIDAANPRTANRALPLGLLSVTEVWVYVFLSFGLLLVAAAQLSPLALRLFPVAVVVLFVYSYTKRFTWLCHLFLGVALGLAPLGSWIAIADRLDLAPALLAAGVTFWVAGFDVIYACHDYDFDRRTGLHSIPARFGLRRALGLSSVFHVLAVSFFLLVWWYMGLGVFYLAGVAVAAGILWYEHRLVSPGDLSRADAAFFNMNGLLSVTMLVFTFLDVSFPLPVL